MRTLLRAAKDIRSLGADCRCPRVQSNPLPHHVSSTWRGCWRRRSCTTRSFARVVSDRNLRRGALGRSGPNRPGKAFAFKRFLRPTGHHDENTWPLEFTRCAIGENLLMVNPGRQCQSRGEMSTAWWTIACLTAKLGHVARESVCQHFRIVDFADRLEAICRRLIGLQAGRNGRAHGHGH